MFKNTLGRQIVINAFLPVVVALIFLEFIIFMNTKRMANELKETEVSQLISYVKQMGTSYTYLFKNAIEEKEKVLEKRLNEVASDFEGDQLSDIEIDELLANAPEEDIHLFVVNYQGAVLKSGKDNPVPKVSISRQVDEKRTWFSGLLVSPKKKRFGIAAFKEIEGQDYLLGASYFPLLPDTVSSGMIEIFSKLSETFPMVEQAHVFKGKELVYSSNKDYIRDVNEMQMVKEILRKDVSAFERIKADGKEKFYFRFGDYSNNVLSDIVLAVDINDGKSLISLSNEMMKYTALLLFTIIAVALIMRIRIKSVTKPIERIVTNAARIRNEDYYERVKFSGCAELNSLVKEFNEMLDQLEEKNEKILSLKASHEKVDNQIRSIQENNMHLKDELRVSKTNNNYNTNYVLRLKQNLLISEASLNQYISQAFIFSRPKGVVGGDYYWFSPMDHHLFFVIGDSTGHGIPGGVISFFGLGLTQHIIKKQRITDPVEFLEALENEMNSLLNQGENDFFFDGMDVAVCSVDIKTMNLKFAGAKRPIYILRDDKVIKLEGVNYPIGKFQENGKKFDASNLQLQKDDKVYMFSDGYIAQTGDLNKKRYSEERFKNLLLKNSQLTFKEQRIRLEQELEDWMGMEEQADDVLVLGFDPYKHKL